MPEEESCGGGMPGMMRLGLVTANHRDDWHVPRLVRALGAVGEVELVEPGELRVVCGRDEGVDRFEVLARGLDARRFDVAVVGRLAGTAVDVDVALDAVRALELLGVPTLNRTGPMLAAQDKLHCAAVLARAGIPTPLCSSVPTARDAKAALAAVGDGVAKPLFGSLGDGIELVRRSATKLAHAVRGGPVLVQRFVPPGGSDLRLFVVGDRVEACIRRIAAEGEWRSNVGRGARAVRAIARPAWKTVAIEATRALGLEVAGVDLALDGDAPTVLEVNGFPGFHGVYEATGRDMAPFVAARAVELARRRVGPGRRSVNEKTTVRRARQRRGGV